MGRGGRWVGERRGSEKERWLYNSVLIIPMCTCIYVLHGHTHTCRGKQCHLRPVFTRDLLVKALLSWRWGIRQIPISAYCREKLVSLLCCCSNGDAV